MLWILTLVAVALSYSAVVLGVATFARVLSWIPSASVRRWTVVGPVTVTLIVFGCITFLFWVVAPFAGPPQGIREAYDKTPTLTILLTPPAFAFCVSVLVASIRGFRAQGDHDYQPRAAAWPWVRLFVRTTVIAVLFVFAVFLQDVELRWRLRSGREAAEATTAAMTPAAVPDEDNAAVHYQRCVDVFEEVDSRHDFDEFDMAMTRLIEEGVDDRRLEAYFQGFEPLFEHFRRGAECGTCRFADEYEPLEHIEGGKTQFQLFRTVIRLYRLAAYRASQQRPSEALEVIRLIRRLEKHLMMDPRNRTTVLYWWLESHAQHAVEHLVTYCDELPEAETRDTMASPLPVDDICRDAARWNAALMQTFVADAYTGSLIPDSFFQKHDPDRAEVAVAMGSATMRFLYARDDLLAVRNAHPFLDDLSLLETDDELVPWEHQPVGEFAWVVGTMSALRHYAVEAEMNRRLSNLGLSAGLYRQRTGEWPTDLADLRKDCLPTDLVDPVTGLAFRVANIRDGVMISSPEIDWSRTPFRDNQNGWDWAARSNYWQRHTLFLGRAHKELQAAEARRQ